MLLYPRHTIHSFHLNILQLTSTEFSIHSQDSFGGNVLVIEKKKLMFIGTMALGWGKKTKEYAGYFYGGAGQG